MAWRAIGLVCPDDHRYYLDGVCVNPMFVPLREETDRTGLELRKSLRCKALRISSAESIVTKRVAHGEPFKSSEYPRERVNGEAEGKRSRLFSLFSGAFRDLGVWRNQTESALARAKNRIFATGPRRFVYNSQILCFTEKSYLTAQLTKWGQIRVLILL